MQLSWTLVPVPDTHHHCGSIADVPSTLANSRKQLKAQLHDVTGWVNVTA